MLVGLAVTPVLAAPLPSVVNLADVGTPIAGVTFNGVDNGDGSGFSVSNAGDINGDGIDDLLIGASQEGPNGIGAGATYLIYGQQTAIPEPGTLALVGVGLVGMAVRKRGARKQVG